VQGRSELTSASMLPVRTSLVPSPKIMVSMVSAVIERDPEVRSVSAADCAPLARKQSSTARVARLRVADMIVALSEFCQTNPFEFLKYCWHVFPDNFADKFRNWM